MASKFETGDPVITPFGKGVVREVRSRQLVIEVNGRAVVVDQDNVSRQEIRKSSSGKKSLRGRPESAASTPSAAGRQAPGEVDLHGLTVEEALARAEQAVNDALLADRSELRLIHGQSGGRIRGALHRRLRDIPTVRAFRLDPTNAGVTIVHF